MNTSKLHYLHVIKRAWSHKDIVHSKYIVSCKLPPEIEPTCKTTPVENEWTEMQCTVIYRGNWVPVMKRRENDKEIIRDDVENVTVSNVTAISTLRLFVRNDVKYTCKVYFSENIISCQDTTQATFYACTWTSDTRKCKTYLLFCFPLTPLQIL